ANDELDTRAATALPGMPSPPLTPTLILTFHRLDLREHRTQGRFDETFRAVLGYDHTLSNGTDFSVWLAEPSITARWVHGPELSLNAGVQGSFHDINQGSGAIAAAGPLAA